MSRARTKQLDRWVRAHNPANEPTFRWWHGVLLLLVSALFVGQQITPGLLADVGTYQIGDWDVSWQLGIYARMTPLLLACWALFGVRAMHPLMYLALLLEVVYLCARIAEIRITHEPLTLSFALLMVLLSVISFRVITRPNEYELSMLAKLGENEESND